MVDTTTHVMSILLPASTTQSGLDREAHASTSVPYFEVLCLTTCLEKLHARHNCKHQGGSAAARTRTACPPSRQPFPCAQGRQGQGPGTFRPPGRSPAHMHMREVTRLVGCSAAMTG